MAPRPHQCVECGRYSTRKLRQYATKHWICRSCAARWEYLFYCVSLRTAWDGASY